MSGAFKGVGEGRVATVACCGASKLGGAPLLSTSQSCQRVEVVPGATALALVCGEDVAEQSIALASSDVVLLELRQSDLEADGPHGMAQLAPLLQRSLPLRGLKPQKKLLVLAVQQDDEPVPKKQLEAFAFAALDRVWAGLRMPDGKPIPLADVFETSFALIPAGAGADKATAALAARFRDAARPDYLFRQGAWSTPADKALSTLTAVGQADHVPGETAYAASDALLAYHSAQVAERAAKSFAKGLAALRKASEASPLPDFGERLAALVADTMAKFDSDAQALQNGLAQNSPTTGAARAALLAQLARGTAPTCRRQLALLQLSTRDKFMQKLQVRAKPPPLRYQLRGRASLRVPPPPLIAKSRPQRWRDGEGESVACRSSARLVGARFSSHLPSPTCACAHPILPAGYHATTVRRSSRRSRSRRSCAP